MNAEVAPGVGNQTDLTVITKDGINFMSQNAVNQLRELHRKTAERIVPLAEVEKILAQEAERKTHEQSTSSPGRTT